MLRRYMSENIDFTESACRNKPTEWWYPDVGKIHHQNASKAIQLCRTCPVQSECLTHALRYETHGIWGGMREAEREIERRRRGIQLAPEMLATMSQSTRRAYRRLNKIEKEGSEVV